MRKAWLLALALATMGAGRAQISTLAGLTEKPIVVAMNRVQELSGENPQSTWLNQEARWVRLGFGAYLWEALCGSQTTCPGNFANLSIVPSSGVNVVVQPTSSTTVGQHMTVGQCTFNNSIECQFTLSGKAAFSNQNTWSCSASIIGGAFTFGVWIVSGGNTASIHDTSNINYTGTANYTCSGY